MIPRVVVFLLLGCLALQHYTKRHSALVDNGVHFYRRLEYKMGTVPIE